MVGVRSYERAEVGRQWLPEAKGRGRDEGTRPWFSFLFFFGFWKRASPRVAPPAVTMAPITADPNPTGTQTGGDARFEAGGDRVLWSSVGNCITRGNSREKLN